MKKYLNIILCFVLFTLLNSCVTQTNVIKSMENVKKSVLKIETWGRLGNCDDKLMSCEKFNLMSTGTGSVVLFSKKKAVLTAAHICVQKESGMLNMPVQYYFKAVDRANKEYIMEIIKYDVKSDICLLSSVSGPLEPNYIKLSLKSLEYAEKVYNLGAPMGIIEKNMVPLFYGHFFGISEDNAYFSLPAIGGSSGSPIINVRAELIGMVHSVHYRFHHITLSATYRRLWNFLNVEKARTTQVRN